MYSSLGIGSASVLTLFRREKGGPCTNSTDKGDVPSDYLAQRPLQQAICWFLVTNEALVGEVKATMEMEWKDAFSK